MSDVKGFSCLTFNTLAWLLYNGLGYSLTWVPRQQHSQVAFLFPSRHRLVRSSYLNTRLLVQHVYTFGKRNDGRETRAESSERPPDQFEVTGKSYETALESLKT